ncbi:MAG TPA: pilus assembly protein PilM, partial [Pirellulaceae bacterium]|nr:pilus assembly protein PilM [Pirellulaceae bacterium]
LLKKVHDAVQYEARTQFPFQLDGLAWDYDLISASGQHSESAESRRAVIVAGRNFHIQERLGIFKEAGIAVDVLQSDCVALHNFLAYEFFDSASKVGEQAAHDAILAIDVGTECTNLVVSSPSAFWFRTLSIGGDNFTEPLVRQFKLTYTQAEQFKREPHRARRMSQLYATFDPLLNELATEVERSTDSFLKLFPDQTLARMVGVGGGFQLHGLFRRLRS